MARKKLKKLKVELTKDLADDDLVIKTNYGRFIRDEKGDTSLLIGDLKIRATAV